MGWGGSQIPDSPGQDKGHAYCVEETQAGLVDCVCLCLLPVLAPSALSPLSLALRSSAWAQGVVRVVCGVWCFNEEKGQQPVRSRRCRDPRQYRRHGPLSRPISGRCLAARPLQRPISARQTPSDPLDRSKFVLCLDFWPFGPSTT